MHAGSGDVVTKTVADTIIESRKIFYPNTTIYLSMRLATCFSYNIAIIKRATKRRRRSLQLRKCQISELYKTMLYIYIYIYIYIYMASGINFYKAYIF